MARNEKAVELFQQEITEQSIAPDRNKVYSLMGDITDDDWRKISIYSFAEYNDIRNMNSSK